MYHLKQSRVLYDEHNIQLGPIVDPIVDLPLPHTHTHTPSLY